MNRIGAGGRRTAFAMAALVAVLTGGEAKAPAGAEPGPAAALRHPVSVVEADLFVQPHRAIMRLRCFADELELIHGVEPLPDGRYDLEELREATVDHGQYLAAKIELIDAEGNILPARITEVVHLQPPAGGLRAGQLMNCFLGYQFEYEYAASPEFLTLRQMMVGERYLLPSELKVMVRQAGSGTPWARMIKPQVPETFRLDWEQPALDEDAPEEDWQAWFDRQRESVLGITSYSSVYSFIYLTPAEVRHEILIPLASLATLLPLERADPMYLEVAEQDRLAPAIGDLFRERNPVTINGQPASPRVERMDFYALDLRDFAVQAERRRISMANGRVGVILSCPTRVPPREVEVRWDLFNDVVQAVDAVVFIGNRVERTQFSRFLADSVWRWQASGDERFQLPPVEPVREGEPVPVRPIMIPGLTIACWIAALLALFRRRWLSGPWRLPVVAALLATGWIVRPVLAVPLPWDRGWEPVTGAVADGVFARLHANLFRAFDYPGESDCYDALARCIDGPLLEQVYLQVRNSLRIREQGGAVARIDAATVDSGVLESADGGAIPAFRYRAKWRLVGTIEHWGHIHQRTNLYEGRFSIARRDGCWKITGLETLDEQQGQVSTSLRRF